MSLILPPAVERRKLIDEEAYGQAKLARHFTEILKGIDPRLELVFVRQPPGVTVDPPAGMVWNRWHIQISDPARQYPEFMPITDADGGYMEPHSGIFDQLREQWLGSADGKRRFLERRLNEAKLKERRGEELREEMREEARLRIKAAFNPSMNFGSRGWTAKAHARRGRSA